MLHSQEIEINLLVSQVSKFVCEFIVSILKTLWLLSVTVSFSRKETWLCDTYSRVMNSNLFVSRAAL